MRPVCYVFGVPKEAIELDADETIRRLDNIAASILTHVTRA